MAECTTFQVRLKIDIWKERRKMEIEFYKWEIADKRVIALKTKGMLKLFP